MDNDYTLTPDEQGMLGTVIAESQAIEAQLRGLLNTIIKFRKLGDGQWSLQGDKLVRMPPPNLQGLKEGQ